MSFAPLRMTRVVVFACQHLALPPLSQKRVKDGAPIFVVSEDPPRRCASTVGHPHPCPILTRWVGCSPETLQSASEFRLFN
jgi:hypothetical protein